MRFSPVQRNPKINLVFAALLIFGGITYAIPIICDANDVKIAALPFTAITLLAVVAAVYLLIRYRMTSFTYIIRLRDETDGDIDSEKVYAGEFDITSVKPELLDFCVYRAQGSRMAAMECVFSLSDLVQASVTAKKKNDKCPTREEIRQSYLKKGEFAMYDYTLTFGLEDALELVFIDGNRYVGVIIEADERMTNYLLSLKN